MDEPPRHESGARVEGTELVIVDEGGSERRVELGCEGVTPVRLPSEVYVLCPPRRVLRIATSDELRVGARRSAIDLSGLQVVDGQVHGLARSGAERPLGQLLVRPRRPVVVDGEVMLPDPRVEAVLARASRLAAIGASEQVVSLLERVAARPLCPPLTWNGRVARGAIGMLSQLPPPEDHSGWLAAGIPMVVLGLVGIVGPLVGYAVEAASRCAIIGGCHGDGPGAAPLVIGLVLGGALLIGGVLAILAGRNVFNMPARQLAGRRRALVRRMRVQSRDLEAPVRAFGHPRCAPVP
ncbi:MAG: hypothetical protein M5U28_45020 [Sandaracinaceae bacterium]|nr:hypothetical protein [Sandaracinaceae bacterium]